MRILIINWSSRRIAGTEDYLTNVIPALQQSGYEIAFAHEVDTPHTRDRIPLPEGTRSWDMSVLGIRRTLDGISAWRPDLIYAHGLLAPKFEAGFLKIAPAVYFTHNYYGTCVSGLKTFKFPVVRPCNRRFGPACLLHYFPRRCGGRNPLTMWKLFRRESRRLKNLSKYRAIVTHSRHMRDEYIRNGLPETDLVVVPSLWTEPFGRIGPEAGLRGVPVAAFEVGGVTDWLISGVNGYLAPGNPPTAGGLAGAIGNCLKDPKIYRELSAGAVTVASQFNLEHHLE